jgi:hypothetical protein
MKSPLDDFVLQYEVVPGDRKKLLRAKLSVNKNRVYSIGSRRKGLNRGLRTRITSR